MTEVIVDHGAVQRLSEGPQSPVGRYLGRLAEEVAVRARAAAPSRSGHLRASIHTTPLAHGGWAVVARADYAIYVERAEPFMVPALRSVVGP